MTHKPSLWKSYSTFLLCQTQWTSFLDSFKIITCVFLVLDQEFYSLSFVNQYSRFHIVWKLFICIHPPAHSFYLRSRNYIAFWPFLIHPSLISKPKNMCVILTNLHLRMIPLPVFSLNASALIGVLVFTALSRILFTIEVWEWISNFIPHLTEHVNTYPYWN